MIWEQLHGPIAPGLELHHINRIKDDNRLENLVLVTRKLHKLLDSLDPDELRQRRIERCKEWRRKNGILKGTHNLNASVEKEKHLAIIDFVIRDMLRKMGG